MKVLLPSLRKNGTIRISAKEVELAVIKDSRSSSYFYADNYCIADEKVKDLPIDTKIIDYDIGLISDPNVLFRRITISVQHVNKVYTLGGVDFILHDYHSLIWTVPKSACTDIKEQLEDVLGVPQGKFSTIREERVTHTVEDEIYKYANAVRDRTLLMGHSAKGTEALQFMVDNTDRFISKDNETKFNSLRRGKKDMEKEDYEDILSNPILTHILRRDRRLLIPFLQEKYNIVANNPWLFRLLFNDGVGYLGSERALLSEYGINDYHTHFQVLRVYSVDALKMHNFISYDKGTLESINVMLGKYGLDAKEFSGHGIVMQSRLKDLITAKLHYKDILKNFKIDYELV